MKALVIAMVVGCGGGEGGGPTGPVDDVGRSCDLGSTVPTNQTVVASPVTSCKSGLCVHAAGAAESECSADCETADDCVKSDDTNCLAGFMCVPVVDVGPFSCRTLCVCADHVPVTACN